MPIPTGNLQPRGSQRATPGRDWRPWRSRPCFLASSLLVAALVGLLPSVSAAASLAPLVEATQPRVVKIHGAGGLARLEAYQSGLLISPEGHVLTAWSYVLDSDRVTVTLSDGRKFAAALLGADPRLEVAVLKIEAAELECFDLAASPAASPGARVLAFSNLFGVATGDEPLSVQKGVIAARTELSARRGAYATVYQGPVYVLDAVTNNPGAAGGALVDAQGRLLGMLGKELRHAQTGTWLNYALPIEVLRETVEAIRSGQFTPSAADADGEKPADPLGLEPLGIVLVPDVLERTPPFIDHVRSGSPAALAGLKADDLVLLVNGRIVPSCKQLVAELEHVDRADEVRLTVQRGEELLEVSLAAP